MINKTEQTGKYRIKTDKSETENFVYKGTYVTFQISPVAELLKLDGLSIGDVVELNPPHKLGLLYPIRLKGKRLSYPVDIFEPL